MSDTIDVGSISARIDIDLADAEAKLRKVEKELAATRADIQDLANAFRSGRIGATEYGAALEDLAENESKLAARHEALTATTTAWKAATALLEEGLSRVANATASVADAATVADAGMGRVTDATAATAEAGKKAETSGRHFARGLQQIAYAADDARWGLNGVINNAGPAAESLARGFGASVEAAAKLGGAVQIAAVAVGILYEHWDELKEALGTDLPKSQAEQMEALAKSTHRTAAETERLNRAKRESHEIDALMASRPKEERERARAVGEAITEGDPEKIRRAVVQTLQGTGRAEKLTPEEEKQIHDDANAPWWLGFVPYVGAVAGGAKLDFGGKKAVEGEQNKRINDQAQKLINDARNDPSKTRELLKLVDINPKAFPPGFSKDLEDALPENRKQQQAWEDQGRANGLKWKADQEKAKAGGKAADKEDAEAGRDFLAQQRMVDRMDKEDAAAERKAAAEARRKAKADQQADRAWHRENSELAETLLPGMDEKYRRLMIKGDVEGATDDQVRGAMAKMLEKSGMSAEDAADAAEDGFQENRRKLNEKLAALAARSVDATSEVHTVSALTSRVQGGVGAQNPLRTTEDYLKQLVEQGKRNENQLTLRVEQ